MNESLPQGWDVEIITRGPHGDVVYREGSNSASFYWQFGGREVIAIIQVTPESEWNDRYPWAAGRRAEVLERMVNDVIRQKAHDCVASIADEDGTSFVYLRSRRPQLLEMFDVPNLSLFGCYVETSESFARRCYRAIEHYSQRAELYCNRQNRSCYIQ